MSDEYEGLWLTTDALRETARISDALESAKDAGAEFAEATIRAAGGMKVTVTPFGARFERGDDDD